MTTLQARNWARRAQRATEARGHSGLWTKLCDGLGFALLVALLAAALAIRVLVYVHL